MSDKVEPSFELIRTTYNKTKRCIEFDELEKNISESKNLELIDIHDRGFSDNDLKFLDKILKNNITKLQNLQVLMLTYNKLGNNYDIELNILDFCCYWLNVLPKLTIDLNDNPVSVTKLYNTLINKQISISRVIKFTLVGIEMFEYPIYKKLLANYDKIHIKKIHKEYFNQPMIEKMMNLHCEEAREAISRMQNEALQNLISHCLSNCDSPLNNHIEDATS